MERIKTLFNNNVIYMSRFCKVNINDLISIRKVRPGCRTAGAGPDAISTGPRCCRALHAHRAPSVRSDWSMRDTIVSGVNCAPTSRPTASLATPHLAQKKSVCSKLSTRDPQ